MLVFDIETEPLEESRLRELLPPFDSDNVDGLVTGEFDPSKVKLGNLKDEAKKQEKIEAARKAHEEAVANSASIILQAEQDHWKRFVDSCCLSAVTSRVLAIGYHAPDKSKTVIHAVNEEHTEEQIIAAFWQYYANCRQERRHIVGVNILGFDVPYVLRRSWILGVEVPDKVYDGRYFDRTFIDLCDYWKTGNFRSSEPANFDALARAFGTVGKNGQSGKYFHEMWKVNRGDAIAYLKSDVEQPAIWARRMGIVT